MTPQAFLGFLKNIAYHRFSLTKPYYWTSPLVFTFKQGVNISKSIIKVEKLSTFSVRALRCKKMLQTNSYFKDLFFGIERYQNHSLAILNLLVGPSQREIRYWWHHKQSEICFHQNTKLSTQVERFSATGQEKYYKHIIIFNT